MLQLLALKLCLFETNTEENWSVLVVPRCPDFPFNKASRLRSLQTRFLLRCCESARLLEKSLRPQYLHDTTELMGRRTDNEK